MADNTSVTPQVNSADTTKVSNVVDLSSTKSTLKIVSNKTHVGPAVKSQNNNTLLSAAANKIRLNNDLKVVPAKEEKFSPKPASGNRSLEIVPKSGEISNPDAIAFMEAWDKLYGDKPGTPDYIEKANALNKARSQVYAALGINPQLNVRPELTEEQRIAYSEAVKPYSFDYYEVRLSFKQTGHKAVRSKTYRFLNAPDLASIRSKLIKQRNVVTSNFSIRSGNAN